MESLIALEPLSRIEELFDLDEQFFTPEGITEHDPQNCFYSQICEVGTHTINCIATQ